jgi:hypothetical protein
MAKEQVVWRKGKKEGGETEKGLFVFRIGVERVRLFASSSSSSVQHLIS